MKKLKVTTIDAVMITLILLLLIAGTFSVINAINYLDENKKVVETN